MPILDKYDRPYTRKWVNCPDHLGHTKLGQAERQSAGHRENLSF